MAVIFKNLTPKAKVTKAKINKWQYMKLQSICKRRKWSTRWKGSAYAVGKNICKSYISKIYKELLQLSSLKTNLIKKWAGDLSRHFPEEDLLMVYRYMKTLLFIQDMQIKTTIRYHFTLVKMAIVKKIRNK